MALYNHGFTVGLGFSMHLVFHTVLITHTALACTCLVPSAKLTVAHEGFKLLLLSCIVPLWPHHSPLLVGTVLGLMCAAAAAVSESMAVNFWCLDGSFSKAARFCSVTCLAPCFFPSFFFIRVSLLLPGCPLCPCSLASSWALTKEGRGKCGPNGQTIRKIQRRIQAGCRSCHPPYLLLLLLLWQREIYLDTINITSSISWQSWKWSPAFSVIGFLVGI